jgi:hypothetical protein
MLRKMKNMFLTQKRALRAVMIPPAVLFLIAVWSGAVPRNASSNVTAQLARANFAPDGNIGLPRDYRQWVHIGTRIKVGGLNILDGTKLATPQVLNAYVEPSAFASYKKTGKWANGTQIVKEISTIKVGKDCDSATFLCTTPLGTGIFEAKYTGIGMMVKDSKRFPSEPGNWGYFSFFRNGSGYEAVAKQRSQDHCAFCHVKLAAETDYVISDAHLALQEDKMQ